jgi:hypothetical protein
LILALSSSPYEEYDPKSKKFITETLDYIEHYFKGYKTLPQQIQNTGKGEKEIS